MKSSYRLGLSFGTVSGVISTLGLMVGLESGTKSESAVIGGIIMIAIADSFSDALSIHVSEESQQGAKEDFIWQATIATFFGKIIIALSFVIPFFFLDLTTSIIVNIIWGLMLIGIINYFVAKGRGIRPFKIIFEHLTITVFVIFVTYLAGLAVRSYLV